MFINVHYMVPIFEQLGLERVIPKWFSTTATDNADVQVAVNTRKGT